MSGRSEGGFYRSFTIIFMTELVGMKHFVKNSADSVIDSTVSKIGYIQAHAHQLGNWSKIFWQRQSTCDYRGLNRRWRKIHILT
ncbi:MAG: hypothetical protein M3Q07_25320 [Pseudobdellovibrionaceae bacterium]|nr:hypothetical protein [Pseudobdellovibrionaceae bacterium]